MSISYHNKSFRSVNNSTNGEVSSDTLFHYQQNGHIISAEYSGGAIPKGTLLGRIKEDGKIEMRYQHFNTDKEFRCGRCVSTPEVLENGKIRLHESWEWTTGRRGSGKSIIEEV